MPTRNKRADRIWLKLTQCYGARVAENYGPTMPEAWVDAIEDLTDEQVAHGLKVVMRESPIHPPSLGQFVQASINMPVAQERQVATLQEQLCEYAAIKLLGRVTPREYSRLWTYVYREWWDASRPKGMERCAECTGVVIDCESGTNFVMTVAEMQADTDVEQRMRRNFRPGPLPARRTMNDQPEGETHHAHVE